MVNYNDGKWHGWNGGECPVHPRSKVDAIWSDGSKREGWFAEDFHWDLLAHPVAFRVVKEYKGPREWWLAPDTGIVVSAAGYAPVGNWVRVREVVE